MDVEYVKLKNSWDYLPVLEVFLDGQWKVNGKGNGKIKVRLCEPAGQSMSHSRFDPFVDQESESICFYIDLKQQVDLTRRNSSQIIPNRQTSNKEKYGLSNAENNPFESAAVFRSQTQNVPPLEVSLVLFLGISKKILI